MNAGKKRTSLGVTRWVIVALMVIPWGITGASPAQNNKILGEVEFEGAGRVERDAGVWVDDQYLGYLKELKGNKRVMLLPGEHRLSVRQAGYENFEQKVVVEPGQKITLRVVLTKNPQAFLPKDTATLKLTIEPGRAAVFLDGKYVGHASEFGGAFHSMDIATGKHQIKVELPGYRTYETEVNLVRGQKAEVKTELIKTSIENSGSNVKPPQS
jgi:PEGA domain